MSDIGIEVKEFNGEGYAPLISYNGWRVAIANFCERLRENNICKVERHLKTDEVFILLEGSASLFMGEDAREVVMEKFLSYVVKKSAWHNIVVSEDARVLIVENKNTGKHNSEYLPFKL